jgi:hypothetical protein
MMKTMLFVVVGGGVTELLGGGIVEVVEDIAVVIIVDAGGMVVNEVDSGAELVGGEDVVVSG